MEKVLQSSLKSWKERLEKEIEDIEIQLKKIDMGSDEDFELSQSLGRKRATLDGIEKELENSARREESKIEIKIKEN